MIIVYCYARDFCTTGTYCLFRHKDCKVWMGLSPLSVGKACIRRHFWPIFYCCPSYQSATFYVNSTFVTKARFQTEQVWPQYQEHTWIFFLTSGFSFAGQKTEELWTGYQFSAFGDFTRFTINKLNYKVINMFNFEHVWVQLKYSQWGKNKLKITI